MRAKIPRGVRTAVFRRDRWTCRLCMKPVNRSGVWPDDPDAPVIDHIIPLSAGPDLGGVDEPYNLQCAHGRCNKEKSDRFDQGALF